MNSPQAARVCALYARRILNGELNIVAQVFMSWLGCFLQTRCVNSELMLKSDQFSSHKKSLKRLTVRREWHRNSFWVTLTCTKFCVCVSCISCTFRSSTSSTPTERELLIRLSGIQLASPTINSRAKYFQFLSSRSVEWQVHETRVASCSDELRKETTLCGFRCNCRS